MMELNLGSVTFSHGFMQAYFNANFYYFPGGTPANLTAFAFKEAEPFDSRMQERPIILNMKESMGSQMTYEDILKNCAQTTSAPSSFDDLTAQLAFFAGVVEITFGKDSSGTKGLKRLLTQLNANKSTIKAMMTSNPNLAAQVLYFIDTRVQRWMRSLENAVDRYDVDDSLVDFNGVVNDVLDSRLLLTLPPCFVSPPNETDPSTQGGGTGGGGRGKKRKAQGGNEVTPEDDRRIPNKDQHPELAMKETDNWDTLCRDASERPKWDDNNPRSLTCLRWHVKGYCFDECRQRASHVPKDKIPPRKVREMKDFLRSRRQE
jgi:hypothetical protein